MLRCPKCGTDNMLSAVFCRGCGERMNLDEIKPDDFENIGTKKDSTTMQNIIGGAIIGVLVVGFLVGFMFPSCGALGTTPEGQQAAVDKYLSSPSVTFTDQELTDFCNGIIARGNGSASEGAPQVSRVSVRCHGDGTVTTYVRATFWGFLPGTISVHCTPSANETVNLPSVDGAGVKIGLLPLPQGMEESLFWPVRSFCSSALSEVNTKVKSLEITEGQVSFKHGKVKLD